MMVVLTFLDMIFSGRHLESPIEITRSLILDREIRGVNRDWN